MIIDVYFLLKNPFASTQKRIRLFIIISVSAALGFAIMGQQWTTSKDPALEQLQDTLYQSVVQLNIVLTIGMSIFAYRRIYQSKMQSDLRKAIMTRYGEIVIILAFYCWPVCNLSKPSI